MVLHWESASKVLVINEWVSDSTVIRYGSDAEELQRTGAVECVFAAGWNIKYLGVENLNMILVRSHIAFHVKSSYISNYIESWFLTPRR